MQPKTKNVKLRSNVIYFFSPQTYCMLPFIQALNVHISSSVFMYSIWTGQFINCTLAITSYKQPFTGCIPQLIQNLRPQFIPRCDKIRDRYA